MDETTGKFENAVAAAGLIARGEKVLAAFSGGPDSVFLLTMLKKISGKYGLGLGAFHLNHNLRETAARDADFSARFCADMDVTLHLFSEDIAAQAAKAKISAEEAGRAARYRLMNSLRAEYGYDKAATGHHMDDNAETVLMRIIRGTGAEGLEGIPPVRDGWIVRPLLAFTKDEIVSYLSQNGIPYMNDETNDETDYFRNRVRSEIMPLMKKENPLFVQGISRMCEIIRADNAFIAAAAERVPVDIAAGKAGVSYEALMQCHAAVRYAVLMKMARAAGADRDYSYAAVSALMHLLNQPQNTSWDVHLPGSVFTRRYDTLSVRAQADADADGGFCFEIKVPSTHLFAASDISLKIYRTKNVKIIRNKFIKYIDYAKIKNILVLRSRREGDSFVKFGQNGRKTLKKYFIDQKITREMRPHVPILADGDDIVCVCGYEIDDRYKADEMTRDYLAIECGGMKHDDER